MKTKLLFLLIFTSLLAFSQPASASINDLRLTAELKVNVVEKKKFLNIIYTIHNLSNEVVAPKQSDQYFFIIRNVVTGQEVLKGTLDNAFNTNVSQYAAPGSHAVFAVKQIPIPEVMKRNPGFYLIFLISEGTTVLPEETVFYVPGQSMPPGEREPVNSATFPQIGTDVQEEE